MELIVTVCNFSPTLCADHQPHTMSLLYLRSCIYNIFINDFIEIRQIINFRNIELVIRMAFLVNRNKEFCEQLYSVMSGNSSLIIQIHFITWYKSHTQFTNEKVHGPQKSYADCDIFPHALRRGNDLNFLSPYFYRIQSTNLELQIGSLNNVNKRLK